MIPKSPLAVLLIAAIAVSCTSRENAPNLAEATASESAATPMSAAESDWIELEGVLDDFFYYSRSQPAGEPDALPPVLPAISVTITKSSQTGPTTIALYFAAEPTPEEEALYRRKGRCLSFRMRSRWFKQADFSHKQVGRGQVVFVGAMEDLRWCP